MKPYIRVLTESPMPVDGKQKIREDFAPEDVRIGSIGKEYSDPEGTRVVEYEFCGEGECCGTPDDCDKECNTKESESEQCGTNKHGQNLELVKQFQEKYGKLPHHKAGDASIIEALKGEAE